MKNRTEESRGDYGQNPNSSYEKLKQLEALPADPNEEIMLSGLHSASQEFLHLQNAGVSLSELQEGKVTRAQLLNAGYVFINRIGGGEKPLISADISLPERKSSINLSNKILLSQEELDAVLDYQAQHSDEFGMGEQDIDTLRADMMLFLDQAMTENRNLKQKSIEAFKAAQRRILDNDKYTESDRQSLIDFFQGLSTKSDAGMTMSFMMESCLQGINLAKVRGIPIEVYGSRLAVLNGSPSPFLDSGYHFDKNYDVTLYPNDKGKTRRLNMVVVHLLSRGLNEIGGSRNNSHDQSYITSGEYVREIQALPHETSGEVSEEDLDLIAMRLLARVNLSER